MSPFMADIRTSLADALGSALSAAGVVVPDGFVAGLERPARREHGDWSSNAALALAKRAGRNPRTLAEELVAWLDANRPEHVAEVSTAGPGFVNFTLAPSWLHSVIREAVAQGVADFGRLDLGRGRTVIVEFVSANPTGPVHAGHGRGAAYGDAVARLLERCGHTVQREFYINDRGTQMDLYAASLAAARAGEPAPEDGYHGQYITEWAAEMPAEADPRPWGRERALADQRDVLGSMAVAFDTWSSEQALVDAGAIDDTLGALEAVGATYEADGARWLRSSEFGDDKDRVLVKSDGQYTYLLPDIAYHRDKFDRAGPDGLLINVWGADHHGYVARMKAAMAALGGDPERLEVEVTQLVRLVRDGVEVKLSKRTGDLIELREVIAEVGADAARFTYLLQSMDSTPTFDLALVASQAMENPVHYVQMAHARLCSIASRAHADGVVRQTVDQVDLGVLDHERELEIMRRLSVFGEVLAAAADERAPHRMVAWLRDFASCVHGFYHDCHVLGAGVAPELTQARLVLTDAARVGLAAGLDSLGVGAPEAM
ncbi:arginine--tRNA ligase [Candidatus Poriferisocius sp.]|uniref:arginine--tRNA ligase n=1 Tax=Candidatus Poriferisocius sp. TaxID=3101276 RepID=UPI003B58ED5F